MDGKALGLIETFGYVPAIEAADAAIKSADVQLYGCRFIGAGLVSIIVTGDISAVKSSVDAAVAAAERLGTVKSHTVIGRTAEGLEAAVTTEKDRGPATEEPEQVMELSTGSHEPSSSGETEVGPKEEETVLPAEEAQILPKEEDTVTPEPEETVSPETEEAETQTEIGKAIDNTSDVSASASAPAPAMDPAVGSGFDTSQLKKMKVVKLRKMALKLDGLSIVRKDIKFAKKKELIEAITAYYNDRSQ